MIARPLTFALACALAAVHADAADRVVGWPGGAADIRTYGPEEPIGRIHDDGSVTFDLPTPPASGQTVAQTFDRCRSGPLTVENGAAEVMPVMPYVEHGGAERALAAASSPEMAEWVLSYGQSPLVSGAHLRWLHVDGAASVVGDCVETLLTVSGDMEFLTEWRLELAPGWNLIRTTFVEYVEHDDGSRHETHTVHDALPSLPEGAGWYLENR